MKKLIQILSKKSWSSHSEIHEFFSSELRLILSKLISSNDHTSVILKFLSFRSILLQHISYETACIYPIFESKVSDYISYGKPTYFEKDHKSLKQMLNELIVELLFIEKKQSILNMYQFYDLLDHHDTRELTALYPLLEKVISADEKNTILDKFSTHIVIENNGNTEALVLYFFELSKLWILFINKSFLSNETELKKKLLLKLRAHFSLGSENRILNKLVLLLEEYEFYSDHIVNIKKLKQCESVLKSLIKQTLLNSAEK